LQDTVDAWNSRLEAAKSDPDEFNALIKDLEGYIGKPLTRQEKADLMSSDADDSDPVMKELVSLKREFTTYREQQDRLRQEASIQETAKQLIAKLDSMESNKEKYPGFDREKVYEAARQAGTTDFDMVYWYLNREDLLQHERDKIEKEYKQLTEKRKAAATEGDASPADLKEPPKKFKKLEDVGGAIMEDIKAGKTSFFTE